MKKKVSQECPKALGAPFFFKFPFYSRFFNFLFNKIKENIN